MNAERIVTLCLALGLGFVPVAQRAVADDKSYKGTCQGKAADEWLPGLWVSGFPGSADKIHVEIRRVGHELMWKYDRGAGVVTQRWGEKKTAEAEGKVESVDGCAVELRGQYTAYGGTQKALGQRMEYSLSFDGSSAMNGTGFGLGKERFQTRFVKSN